MNGIEWTQDRRKRRAEPPSTTAPHGLEHWLPRPRLTDGYLHQTSKIGIIAAGPRMGVTVLTHQLAQRLGEHHEVLRLDGRDWLDHDVVRLVLTALGAPSTVGRLDEVAQDPSAPQTVVLVDRYDCLGIPLQQALLAAADRLPQLRLVAAEREGPTSVLPSYRGPVRVWAAKDLLFTATEVGELARMRGVSLGPSELAQAMRITHGLPSVVSAGLRGPERRWEPTEAALYFERELDRLSPRSRHALFALVSEARSSSAGTPVAGVATDRVPSKPSRHEASPLVTDLLRQIDSRSWAVALNTVQSAAWEILQQADWVFARLEPAWESEAAADWPLAASLYSAVTQQALPSPAAAESTSASHPVPHAARDAGYWIARRVDAGLARALGEPQGEESPAVRNRLLTRLTRSVARIGSPEHDGDLSDDFTAATRHELPTLQRDIAAHAALVTAFRGDVIGASAWTQRLRSAPRGSALTGWRRENVDELATALIALERTGSYDVPTIGEGLLPRTDLGLLTTWVRAQGGLSRGAVISDLRLVRSALSDDGAHVWTDLRPWLLACEVQLLLALHRGDEADVVSRRAPSGHPAWSVARSHVLAATGRWQECAHLALQGVSASSRLPGLAVEAHAVAALALHQLGTADAATHLLRTSVALTHRHGILRRWTCVPRWFVELYAPEVPGLQMVVDALDAFALTAVHPETVPLIGLSTREQQVLRALASSQTLAEIAQEQFVSPETIKSQARAVYRKLGVASRSAAVQRAAELGLIPG